MTILWAAAAVSGLVAGACLVGALVTRAPMNLLALACAGGSTAAATIAAAGLAADHGTPLAGIAAFAFACAAFAGGYRAVASALLDALGRPRSRPTMPSVPQERLAVILSDAEPIRYSPRHAAARLRRIERSGAASLTPGVLPMIFLAERMRYRAIRGPHPARFVVQAVAEAVGQRLAESAWPTPIAIAYVDGAPRLADVLARSLPRSVLVLELGPAGSLPFIESCREAEDATHPPSLLQPLHPSVWRDHRLTQRLAERVCDRVPAQDRESTGIVLLGAGIPDEWRPASARWAEDENYFLTRTALLLQGAGFCQNNIRPAWLEWQTPTLAEAVRHLAAIGCVRIVVVLATMIQPDLSALIDVERDMRDARIPEHVRTTVLPPWGNDPVLVEVIASRFEDALSRLASPS